MRELALAFAALGGVVAYGVLAGADFGGGIWDLVARGPRKEEQRRAIASAMAPVWEANHVWLIFVIVVLFGGFPAAYSALSTALFVPFHLVLVGITLRGVAFVFRAYGPRSQVRPWGAVFGASSSVTPLLLGIALGAVSDGGIRVEHGITTVASWLSAWSLATGALALSLCAYLAAVFLTNETEGELREDFRLRALVAGGVVVAFSVLALPLAVAKAPHLAGALWSARAFPVLGVGAAASLTSGFSLLRRRFRLARASATVQVALLLLGWGLAQYPYLVYPDVTIDGAGGSAVTQSFMLATLPFGAVVLGPSLWLLFRVFKRHAL